MTRALYRGGIVTSLPFVVTEEARGIVVRAPAAEKPRPVHVWAYMWATDDDEAEEHWHEKVPVERAA